MLPEPIPSSFLLKKTDLSLAELRWAFDNGLIGAQSVVDVAAAMVAKGDDSVHLVHLAGILHSELPEVRGILESIPIEDAELTRRKWVWLVLSWVYERRHNENDVFDTIDSLYADLGYPEEMVPFGPYAPVYQAKGDPTEMREQVLGEWRRYLERGEELFGAVESHT